MSFQDDAIEPLAVESAEHFAELLKRAAEQSEGTRFAEERSERRERMDPRRAMPRELGN